jgi:filamentous hemagglutinin family protein
MILSRSLAWLGFLGFALGGIGSVQAQQVVPDSSLNTQVTRSGDTFTITQGSAAGANLFHSFSEFSIPTGGTATFNLVNTPAITTIFSRVTGGRASNIDGLIRTTNSTNPVSLFLINPNGILFGSNARLNIGGSFVGTTASSIQFANGAEFASTATSLSAPLLTVSVPIGLQMGQNPGAIQLQGKGHPLTAQHPTLAPYQQSAPHTGLGVNSGQTLALVGGSIDLNGGILTAPAGRIEVGGVVQGQVTLQRTSAGLGLDYTQATQFGDVQLSGRSLLDVNSRSTAGSIQVQGNHVHLRDGSVLWVQNRGLQPAGSIRIQATGSLRVEGATPGRPLMTSILSETVAGSGGNIQLAADQIHLTDGGVIATKTFSRAASGTIDVQTRKLVVEGYVPKFPDLYSFLATLTVGQGNSGHLKATTQEMAIRTGGYVGSSTLGSGQGGNVWIQADAITVESATPALFPSTISASSIGRGGNSGQLTINTRTLKLKNSGFVATSSLGIGSGGNLVINASESIEIGGRYAVGAYQSTISSTIDIPTPSYAKVFGLTGEPVGSAGNVTVNTTNLRMNGPASITSSNRGLGDAGTVSIAADSIWVSQGASIMALTKAGEGGNIDLRAQNLILRRGGFISATAGEFGNGGNIKINAPIIVGLENSDITANSRRGRGGNIEITTQGMVGLLYRPKLTPENDITASSEFGVNGSVQVNNVGVDPNSGLSDLPTDLIDASQQVASQCAAKTGSRFVLTGRGGILQDPTQASQTYYPWQDLRPVAAEKPAGAIGQVPISEPNPLEATGLQVDDHGAIALIAAPQHQPSSLPTATCSSTPVARG